MPLGGGMAARTAWPWSDRSARRISLFAVMRPEWRLQQRMSRTVLIKGEVAVIATGASFRARRARCLAPMDVWLLRALMAAMRRACATLLTTLGDRPGNDLPPLMRVPGASPGQDGKCRPVGKADRSGPISDAMAVAVVTPIVGIAVRPAPIIPARARTVSLSLAARPELPRRGAGVSAAASAPPPSGPSSGGVRLPVRSAIRASQAPVCPVRWPPLTPSPAPARTGAPRATLKRRRDRVAAGPDARVPERREALRIALAAR